MPNKVLRLLFLSVPLPVTLAGTCITAGTPSMCYAATTDTEKGVINIAQSVSAVRSESEEQNYTFSYSAYDPATYDGKVGFSNLVAETVVGKVKDDILEECNKVLQAAVVK